MYLGQRYFQRLGDRTRAIHLEQSVFDNENEVTTAVVVVLVTDNTDRLGELGLGDSLVGLTAAGALLEICDICCDARSGVGL